MRVHLNMDQKVTEALEKVARKNHRTVSSEILVAVERHIATWQLPPEVGRMEGSDDDHPF